MAVFHLQLTKITWQSEPPFYLLSVSMSSKSQSYKTGFYEANRSLVGSCGLQACGQGEGLPLGGWFCLSLATSSGEFNYAKLSSDL